MIWPVRWPLWSNRRVSSIGREVFAQCWRSSLHRVATCAPKSVSCIFSIVEAVNALRFHEMKVSGSVMR